MRYLCLPDLNFLKSILDYNPDTGEFRYKINICNRNTIGSIAGYLKIDQKNPNNNYYKIQINGNKYSLHRIAYYYVTGIDPAEKEIDHINGNTLDNRFDNLRLATHANNCKNVKKHKDNTSGFKGVSWHKRIKKWQVRIRANNKLMHLGFYNSKFYAALVYARAARKYFGEWRRLNIQ